MNILLIFFSFFISTGMERCCSARGSVSASLCVIATLPAGLPEFDFTVETSCRGGSAGVSQLATSPAPTYPAAVCARFDGRTVGSTSTLGCHSGSALLAGKCSSNDAGAFLAAARTRSTTFGHSAASHTAASCRSVRLEPTLVGRSVGAGSSPGPTLHLSR